MSNNIKLVPAADKTLKIIEYMSKYKKDGFGVTEIANALNYNKGTVHSILQTIIANDWIEHDSLTGKYHLSNKIVHLGSMLEFENKLISDFLLVANELERECGELINLHILKNMTHVVLISKVISTEHSIRVDFPIGSTIPVTVSSAGKCLISTYDDDTLKHIFHECNSNYTKKTIHDEAAFLEEIHQVRKNGYATNRGEYENGIYSIAVPIKNSRNVNIAAINIVIPETRLSPDYKNKLLPLLKEKSAYLSAIRK